MSIEVTPCGGCGNADPSSVCIGCRHSFYRVKIDPDKNECSPVADERKAYSDGYDQGYVHGQTSKTAEIDRLRGVLSEIRKVSADFSIPVMDRIDQCFDMSFDALADGEGVGK